LFQTIPEKRAFEFLKIFDITDGFEVPVERRRQAMKDLIYDFANDVATPIDSNQFECKIDGKRFNSKASFFNHIRTSHQHNLETLFHMLLDDMEQDHLGNFFTKLFYSDSIYPCFSESNQLDFHFPSVLAPDLTLGMTKAEKKKNKRKKKKKRKQQRQRQRMNGDSSVASRRAPSVDILTKKELLELEKKIYKDKIINSEPNVLPTNPILQEDEKIRIKREAAIILEAQNVKQAMMQKKEDMANKNEKAKKVPQNQKQSPRKNTSSDRAQQGKQSKSNKSETEDNVSHQKGKKAKRKEEAKPEETQQRLIVPKQLREQLAEELAAELLEEVVINLCNKLATRSYQQEMRRIAKEKQEEELRRKQEEEEAMQAEKERRKRERQLRREIRKQEAERWLEIICDEVVAEELRDILTPLILEMQSDWRNEGMYYQDMMGLSPEKGGVGKELGMGRYGMSPTSPSPSSFSLGDINPPPGYSLHGQPSWNLSSPPSTSSWWTAPPPDTPPNRLSLGPSLQLSRSHEHSLNQASSVTNNSPSPDELSCFPSFLTLPFSDSESLAALQEFAQLHNGGTSPRGFDQLSPRSSLDSVDSPHSSIFSSTDIFSSPFSSNYTQNYKNSNNTDDDERSSLFSTEQWLPIDNSPSTGTPTSLLLNTSPFAPILEDKSPNQPSSYHKPRREHRRVRKRPLRSVPEDYKMDSSLCVVCNNLPDHTTKAEISNFLKDFKLASGMDHMPKIQFLNGDDLGCCFVELCSKEEVRRVLRKRRKGKIGSRIVNISSSIGIQTSLSGQKFVYTPQSRNLIGDWDSDLSSSSSDDGESHINSNSGSASGSPESTGPFTLFNPVAPEFIPKLSASPSPDKPPSLGVTVGGSPSPSFRKLTPPPGLESSFGQFSDPPARTPSPPSPSRHDLYLSPKTSTSPNKKSSAHDVPKFKMRSLKQLAEDSLQGGFHFESPKNPRGKRFYPKKSYEHGNPSPDSSSELQFRMDMNKQKGKNENFDNNLREK